MFNASASTNDLKEKRFHEKHKDDGLDSLSDVPRIPEFRWDATTGSVCFHQVRQHENGLDES
jgi:hypothetical protein